MTQALLPAWPKNIPYKPFPVATIKFPNRKRLDPRVEWDRHFESYATQLAERESRRQCSNFTGTWTELMFVNHSDYNANASTNVITTMLAGVNEQPILRALMFANSYGIGKTISILARGVIGTTGSPTIIFTFGVSSTVGVSQALGTTIGVSPTITAATAVTNKWWEARLDLTCYTPGSGASNLTLSGAGYVNSPAGFTTPFVYALEPSTPDTATWTITLDASVTYFLQSFTTWSASSSSNTVQIKQLLVYGCN